MPQGRVISNGSFESERRLTGLFFGNKNFVNAKSRMVSPHPLVIFCKSRKDQTFIGIGLEGMSSKFCEEFFPTPSDVGICQTKNLDVDELIHINQAYYNFFESSKRQSNAKIEGGNRNAESTIILMTDNFDDNNPEVISNFIISKMCSCFNMKIY